MNTTCKLDDIINKLEGDFYNNLPQNVLLYLKEFKNQSRQLQETREQLKQANEELRKAKAELYQLHHGAKPKEKARHIEWDDLIDMIGEPIWYMNLYNNYGEWCLISKANKEYVCFVDKEGFEHNYEKERYDERFTLYKDAYVL